MGIAGKWEKSDTAANYEFHIFIKLIWNNGKLRVTGRVKEPDIPLPFRFLHARDTTESRNERGVCMKPNTAR